MSTKKEELPEGCTSFMGPGGVELIVSRFENCPPCGYISIPSDNWAFGKHYDACNDVPGINVHGGFTFSAPRWGRPWLLGFDCGHGGDSLFGGPGRVWTDEDILLELVSAVESLLAASGPDVVTK